MVDVTIFSEFSYAPAVFPFLVSNFSYAFVVACTSKTRQGEGKGKEKGRERGGERGREGGSMHLKNIHLAFPGSNICMLLDRLNP